MTAKVLGKSGKIELYKGTDTSVEAAVRITMDAIRERDAAGNTFNGGQPSSKRKYENFAQTIFTFGSIEDTTVPGCNRFNDCTTGVGAKKIDFSVPNLGNGATLKISLLTFLERGVVKTTDTEAFPVAPGSSKFDIYIDNWTFCSASDAGSPCQGGTGEYVDVDIQVVGSLLGAQCTGHTQCLSVTSLNDDTACLAAVTPVVEDCTGGAVCDAVTGSALYSNVACLAASTPAECNGGAQCDAVETSAGGNPIDPSTCTAASLASQPASCDGGYDCGNVTDLSTSTECINANKTDGTTPCDYTAAVTGYTCTHISEVNCTYVPRVEPCLYSPAGGSFEVGDLPTTTIVNGTALSTGTPLELQPGLASLLSNRVEVDNSWTDMPTGFPSSTSCGDGCFDFVFRLPKGTNLHYDPVILADDPIDDSSTGGGSNDGSGTTTSSAENHNVAPKMLVLSFYFIMFQWF